jgi:hypothetical protein
VGRDMARDAALMRASAGIMEILAPLDTDDRRTVLMSVVIGVEMGTGSESERMIKELVRTKVVPKAGL